MLKSFREGEPLIGPPLCRQMLVSRTATFHCFCFSSLDENQFDSVPDAEYEEFSIIYVQTVENSFDWVYLYNIQPVFFIYQTNYFID